MNGYNCGAKILAIRLKKQLEDKVIRKVKRANRKLSSNQELSKIGNQTIEQIQLRTRLGKGVEESNGRESRLEPLAPSTKRQRKRKGIARPNRSYLTETGQMLDSIRQRIMAGTIKIFFTGTRDDGLSNDELADIHQNKGAGRSRVKRPFFFISKNDARKLRFTIRQRLRQILKI